MAEAEEFEEAAKEEMIFFHDELARELAVWIIIETGQLSTFKASKPVLSKWKFRLK